MTYEVTWADEALAAAQTFMIDDPPGLAEVFDTVDRLAEEPRPPRAVAWGRSAFLRLPVGRYRVLYEIDDVVIRVVVVHLGRSR